MSSPESGHKLSKHELETLEEHYLLPRVSQETTEIVETLISQGRLNQEYSHIFAEENEVLFEQMNFLRGKIAAIQDSVIPYDGSEPWLTGYRDRDPLFIAKNIYLLLEKQETKGKKKDLVPKVSAETISETSESLRDNPDLFDQEIDVARQDNPHLFDLLYKMAERYENSVDMAQINFDLGQIAYYILRTQAEKDLQAQSL